MVARRKKTKSASTMAGETIPLMDIKTGKLVILKRKKFEDKLLEIKDTLAKVLNKVDTIGDYKLDTIQLSVGVNAGWLVVTVQGGISLGYAYKPKR